MVLWHSIDSPDRGASDHQDRIDRLSSEVAFFGGAYPLLSMQTEVAGAGYQKLLFGEKPTKDQIDKYSAELHITPNISPAFVAHALDDKGVLAENSLRFESAYKKARVRIGHSSEIPASTDMESAIWVILLTSG